MASNVFTMHRLMQSEAALCCRALGAEQDGFVTYGKFRNFLILLPEAKLREADPSIAWYEAATMVPFGEHLPPALDQAASVGHMLTILLPQAEGSAVNLPSV